MPISGSNYFDSRTSHQISSQAAFGEIYWNITDDLKLTTGLRYTVDRKRAQPYQPRLLTAGIGQAELARLSSPSGAPAGRRFFGDPRSPW
ncbi:TonB-dependent receptor [Phenylobacterium sp.]|uniref:TonB-dependent receptor n=1 Tax=Phenylobacterium sp. TaxID=1871053 RepID=UPI002718BB66|nr:TonB-dependent receptor [Phenylobacterium sp.]MDO8381257.1 TonB-dependent receptor [Phenylobacterium sp.]